MTCSPFVAERHRALAREPGGELLVGLDEPVAPDAHDDRAQPVEHVVRAIGLRGDLRVEPDQRLAQMVLDEHLVRLARKVLRREEVPAEAGDLPLPAREARTDGGVVRDAAAEAVADEGFDGVGFVEASLRCSASINADELRQSLRSRSLRAQRLRRRRSTSIALDNLSCSPCGGNGNGIAAKRRCRQCGIDRFASRASKRPARESVLKAAAADTRDRSRSLRTRSRCKRSSGNTLSDRRLARAADHALRRRPSSRQRCPRAESSMLALCAVHRDIVATVDRARRPCTLASRR